MSMFEYSWSFLHTNKYKIHVFIHFVNDEDGGDVAIEGLDVENFGFPYAHFQSPYSNFQNEWRHEFYIY